MATDILDQMAKTRIPSQITSQLFVGNYSSSRNFEFINENKITHILTVANDIDPEYPSNCKYKIVNVDDWHEEDLSQHFHDCFSFIDDGMQAGGSVLVHCLAGISRSPAIVIGYLMYKDGLTLDEAYNIVKEKRPLIGPNSGFLDQLTQLEIDLRERRRHSGSLTAPVPTVTAGSASTVDSSSAHHDNSSSMGHRAAIHAVMVGPSPTDASK